MSIKAKLYVFVLGIFIFGVGGAAYWNEVQIEHAVLEILKDKQEEGTHFATGNMQRVIDRLDYALEELARGTHSRDVLLNGQDSRTALYANSRLDEMNKAMPETSVVGVIRPDGLVVASSSKNAVGTMNLSDRDYFKAAMQGKKVFSEPTLSRTTNKPSIMYAMPVTDQGKILGVIYMTVDLGHVFADVAKMKSGKNGYAFIVDRKGIMLYHPDSKRIFADTSKEEWAAPLWKGNTDGYFECNFAGSRWLVNYTTMPSTGWIVMVNAEDTDLLTSLMEIRTESIFTYGLLFLLIAFTVWFFARSLGKAFDQGIAFAKRVEGGDFEARWHTTSKDELGKLAASLNAAFDMVANQAVWFRNLLNAIKSPIAVMGLDEKFTFTNAAFEALTGKSGAELLGKPCCCINTEICNTDNCAIRSLRRGESTTHFTLASRNYEVSSYHMQDRNHQNIGFIEVISDITEAEALKLQAAEAALHGRLTAARQLEAVVDVISSASAELSNQIEHSEQGATEQAARVSETATAMNEMNSTVLEVASNAGSAADISLSTRAKAETGASVVQQAVESIQIVQKQSLALKEDMATLGENAQSISQIMGVISDIADQTNLLALNAAIEAARAGEAGRGFAVVADEVRKLAEKTMQSTTDVANAIRAIQTSATTSMVQVDETVRTIEDATTLAARSGEALAEIVKMVDNTADQVRAIATASEQQSASSEEINQSIMQVNNIATDTAHAMSRAARAVEEMTAQTQTLTELIDDMKKE